MAVEPKFRRTGLDPWSIFGALGAACEKLLVTGSANINVAHHVAACLPGNCRLARYSPARDWVGIGAKDHAGGGRFSPRRRGGRCSRVGSWPVATYDEKPSERQTHCSGP